MKIKKTEKLMVDDINLAALTCQANSQRSDRAVQQHKQQDGEYQHANDSCEIIEVVLARCHRNYCRKFAAHP